MLHWKMSSLIVEEVKKHRLESKLIAMEVERLQKEETFASFYSPSFSLRCLDDDANVDGVYECKTFTFVLLSFTK